ncbi:MAG: hypothetical protein ACKPES_14490, partial [Dolichospermum sp.]
MNFILADIELIGKDSFNFLISLAKYITLMDKIVVLSSIFSRNSISKIRTHTQGMKMKINHEGAKNTKKGRF